MKISGASSKRGMAAAAVVVMVGASGVVWATQAGAIGGEAEAASAKLARAVMKDPQKREVADVTFRNRGKVTEVVAVFRKNSYVKPGFHGFHVHANNLAADGRGCKADPDEASSTWFVSADGHLANEGETHANHAGDMPSVYTLKGGKGNVAFSIDKIPLRTLRGAAVMLHAGPDNFGNIPLGDEDDQYTANSDEATTATDKTGNSGDRVACGVIR